MVLVLGGRLLIGGIIDAYLWKQDLYTTSALEHIVTLCLGWQFRHGTVQDLVFLESNMKSLALSCSLAIMS